MNIRKINTDDWKLYKEVRLEALKNEPLAFGSSYEESLLLTTEDRKRMGTPSIYHMYWVFKDKKIVWIAWRWSNQMKKMRHVADIFWVYLHKEYRWSWLAKKLFDTMLFDIQNEKICLKMKLSVNVEQIAAVKFYKSYWFVEVWRYKGQLWYEWNYYDESVMEYYMK